MGQLKTACFVGTILFSKRNKNGKEYLDRQSFGRKLEVNCKKVFLKPQFEGHKVHTSRSRADKGDKNYYDKSMEGENSSKNIDKLYCADLSVYEE